MVHTKAKYVFYGSMLVDDKPSNVEEWAAEHLDGVPVMWSQPYNSGHRFPQGVNHRVVRTDSWEDLVKILQVRSKYA